MKTLSVGAHTLVETQEKSNLRRRPPLRSGYGTVYRLLRKLITLSH